MTLSTVDSLLRLSTVYSRAVAETSNDLARRGFRCSAPAVWNSVPRTVLESTSITIFKSTLKTPHFDLAHIKHNDVTHTTPPLKL